MVLLYFPQIVLTKLLFGCGHFSINIYTCN